MIYIYIIDSYVLGMRTVSSEKDLHSLDVDRDSKFLAAQVGAFFFAGIIFCIAIQGFYVYINIFRAYERPVLWAFLCSVPLRGLKTESRPNFGRSC